MASPKKWTIHNKKGGHCIVDTPSTIRARELRDLYNALNVDLISVDERLQILLHVKYTVKEFDCNLTRDIVELIDREGDLLSRGRDAKSLEGLRKRIGNLFLHFIETPEFNPEAKSFQKFPDAGQSWKKEQAVYYCRGCTKYLPSTEFYLSTTMRHLGKCKSCTTKENIANYRNDDTCYLQLLKSTQQEETLKRKANQSPTRSSETTQEQENGSLNSILLLQESDVRYLVDIVWNKQSAISRCKEIEELILTRWIQSQELSPWNSILLTVAEAKNHDKQSDPLKVYSEEFIRRVNSRHIAAKQHFSQLPVMEKYMKQNYFKSLDGAFVNTAIAGSEKKESRKSSKNASKSTSKTDVTVGDGVDISIVGQVIPSR